MIYKNLLHPFFGQKTPLLAWAAFSKLKSMFRSPKIIKDQLAAGIIRPSTSATCSPVNLVLKEDGLTIDYRKVNNATLPNPYPLPRIDDIIVGLAKNKYFSKIDLANGYYQVLMDKDSIKFTTFISEFGKHEYLAMPMGLKNAGSTFQRMMDKVIDGLIHNREIFYVYLDDIIIFCEDSRAMKSE